MNISYNKQTDYYFLMSEYYLKCIIYTVKIKLVDKLILRASIASEISNKKKFNNHWSKFF